ncbi:two-component system regulatory protein YycI [Paenibacillus sp. YYML68]|uniref:two-component system regulatory protein YycI n=1 Tax=Paenibacillus sp. YYML68 TaxID=2909250 RepID=UPI00249312B9|nr:two-component system regulatory protein YycI [Paenibacillus sp. YYML68]
MDWGRAKTILILSFLLLNVVLGFQLSTSRTELLELGVNPDSQVMEELQQLLKLKNIQVPADIPKEKQKLKEIVARFDDYHEVERPIPVPTPFKFDPLINKGTFTDMLAKTGIPNTDSYQFDPVTSDTSTFVFHQLYGSLPMFEAQLKLFEKDGMVTSYQQGYVRIMSEGTQPEQSVISPYIALRSLVENYLEPGTVITGVRLGYHGQLYNSQTLYMVPTWRISLGNGDLYWVHAINGAVEPPQRIRPAS